MKVTRRSPFSGKLRRLDLDITQEQIDRWLSGELIQNVFPHLSAGEREFLKTGITEEEWNDTFNTKE
jgi:hypothetical protein